ncbi:hypothetical protein [Pseudomonas syringae group genomosp. 3]|uniref:hypothetical protein n=1 Tax=Pseudomonas syringae group genomosp. 3 TaxID=251701 RepID=UPI00070E5A4A|nr:hypothetical protein [Pseudomonas syringae group genomosp. 3]
MDVREDPCYEKNLIRERRWFVFFTVLAVIVVLAVMLVVWIFDRPSSWIARSGAIMAAIAFLAHLKFDAMMKVLHPNGLVDISLKPVKQKYLPQVLIFGRIAVAVVLIGSLVWGFGDLIPIGATSAQ